MTTNRIRGFTLIELSIVLVIIGLIVGGVLVGRDLIRTAQLNTIISEQGKFVSAINTFRGKYNQIPGDMNNATTFWGAAGGSASDNYTTTCYNTTNTSISPGDSQTCNGNANGMIGCAGAQSTDIMCGDEGLLVWQHLGNAGLIDSRTQPSRSASVGGVQQAIEAPGVTIPAAKINKNTGWSLWYLCLSSESALFSGYSCGHKFFYGMKSATANFNWLDLAFYEALTGSEARSIDLKVDDGKPGTGTISTMTTTGNTFVDSCATTSSPSTATYNTSASSPVCALFFNAGL